ncbi:hypothetical protein Catovirus_1_692 [Catovirus CTV1]|mgnify:CR=1 FL=1|uniref:Uncharacterized protein n=1 Tax=Catovirus CTV1 TaxID=1977631 RepID=A0A1V0SAA5_9VIRU|nr:hypothetical protein Catovirus_1_692 [Catovirus CTV1]
MTNPFIKKWYKKYQKDIKKYVKYLKASDEPLKKMSLDDLREYLKLKVRIWELLTSRNQDLSDQTIDEMSKKELLDNLEFYEENGQGMGVDLLIQVIEALL